MKKHKLLPKTKLKLRRPNGMHLKAGSAARAKIRQEKIRPQSSADRLKRFWKSLRSGLAHARKSLVNRMLVKNGLIKLEIILIIIEVSLLVKTVPSLNEILVRATTAEPEKFTELYFENHNDLPGLIDTNQIYNFRFTLHNAEYQIMNYPYEGYIEQDNQKILISKGILTLEPDEYKTTEVYFNLNNLKSKITINLTGKNQSIAFWMQPS